MGGGVYISLNTKNKQPITSIRYNGSNLIVLHFFSFMQGHTLSNYLVIQIFFKYINIVLLMMILFISIFVKKYFKMILLIIIYE